MKCSFSTLLLSKLAQRLTCFLLCWFKNTNFFVWQILSYHASAAEEETMELQVTAVKNILFLFQNSVLVYIAKCFNIMLLGVVINM